MCWDLAQVDVEVVGTCTPFCTGTADAPSCPAGSSCSMSCEGSLSLCIHHCDPLAQDCLGTACFFDGVGFKCIFTTSNIPEGQPCGYINDCAAGLLCADAATLPSCAGSACCAAFCDLDEPACSLPGTECVPFFEDGMAPPEYDDVGICIAEP